MYNNKDILGLNKMYGNNADIYDELEAVTLQLPSQLQRVSVDGCDVDGITNPQITYNCLTDRLVSLEVVMTYEAFVTINCYEKRYNNTPFELKLEYVNCTLILPRITIDRLPSFDVPSLNQTEMVAAYVKFKLYGCPARQGYKVTAIDENNQSDPWYATRQFRKSLEQIGRSFCEDVT